MLREGELFETGKSTTESDSEPASLASRLMLSLLILLGLSYASYTKDPHVDCCSGPHLDCCLGHLNCLFPLSHSSSQLRSDLPYKVEKVKRF